MSNQVALPSVGRIVHYFPKGTRVEDSVIQENGVSVAAAMVTQTFGGNMANLNVYGAYQQVNVFSVHHKSECNSEIESYWDWPERK